MRIVFSILAALLLLSVAPSQIVVMPIPTSDAIDLARRIARDEGYDVRKTTIYYFESLNGSEGKPLLQGYTTIAFHINGDARNLIGINNSTGQSIDYNTCEVFEYPDLKPFQERILRLTKTTRKTPQQLADDVGCSSPKILDKSVAPS